MESSTPLLLDTAEDGVSSRRPRGLHRASSLQMCCKQSCPNVPESWSQSSGLRSCEGLSSRRRFRATTTRNQRRRGKRKRKACSVLVIISQPTCSFFVIPQTSRGESTDIRGHGSSTSLQGDLVDASLAHDVSSTDTSCSVKSAQMTIGCGSLLWMAPEVFPQTKGSKRAKVTYSQSIDVFSFGVMMWESLEMTAPWSHKKLYLKWPNEVMLAVESGSRRRLHRRTHQELLLLWLMSQCGLGSFESAHIFHRADLKTAYEHAFSFVIPRFGDV